MYDDDVPAWANRWGFKVPVTATTTGQVQLSDLIAVDVTEPRIWTLHLNALRYQGGQLPAGATVRADNQTQSLQGGNSPGQGWKATIFFGVGDGAETVVVDYYARGCTVPVHGSMVRVGLSGSINASNSGLAPPILSGFITPHHRTSPLIQSPTFTTQVFTVAPAGAALVTIPDRATAYRFMNVGATSQSRTVQQLDGGDAIVVQTDLTLLVPPLATQLEQSNYSGYIPLSPAAQFLSIANSDVGTAFYAVQFMLDMG